MSRPLHLFAVLGFSVLILTGRARAADPANSEDDRLRAAYRDAVVQLQSAQADLAAAQAAVSAAADEKKALAEKYDTMRKNMEVDRSSNQRTTDTLNAQLAESKAAIQRLTSELANARDEGAKAARAAQGADAKGIRQAGDIVVLQRRVSSLETKNLALFLVGNEILDRYADFSFGNALRAREPFVGLTRTKLENLVQDYQDKLLDQRDKP